MVIYNSLPRWCVILEEMINTVELELAEKEKGATTAPTKTKAKNSTTHKEAPQ